MKHSFARALKEVLKSEGGYVNHPKDPGGATNKGITQATYDAYRSRKQSVRLITDAEVASIYKSRYWDAVQADDLPAGLDYAVFDFAVNSGPVRAIRFLQDALGVSVDGQIGPLTVKAALRHPQPLTVISKLCDKRLYWLKLLKTWPTFGKGWESRVNSVRSLSLKMAQDGPPVSREPLPALQATHVPPSPPMPFLEPLKPSTGLWAWLKSLFS